VISAHSQFAGRSWQLLFLGSRSQKRKLISTRIPQESSKHLNMDIPTKAWRFAVAAWICLIFFSSTSVASEWSESAFSGVTGLLFRQLHPNSHPFEVVHLLADKGLHLTLFCILAILLWQALPQIRRKTITILICGAFVGSCSELLQSFFPGRDPAIRDVFINIAGTAIGIALYRITRTTSRSTVHAGRLRDEPEIASTARFDQLGPQSNRNIQ
jgi:VanZ family protein